MGRAGPCRESRHGLGRRTEKNPSLFRACGVSERADLSSDFLGMGGPAVRETPPLTRRDRSKETGSSESVPAPMVERAFRLLDLVASSEVGYSLSELARLLGMSKGSVFGLLRTLERARAVEVDEDRRYALGPHIYHLAESYVRRSGLRRFALPA